MKELQALELLPAPSARRSLIAQAFRPGQDYSMMPILVSGFQVWNRLAEDPTSALEALSSQDSGEADWAEWSLVKAGPDILPAIRHLLPSSHADLRRRLLEILVWQADTGALPLLQTMEKTEDGDRESIRWAMTRIEAFCIGTGPVAGSCAHAH
jgi:glycerophosphoryl diester phosphodiesterase